MAETQTKSITVTETGNKEEEKKNPLFAFFENILMNFPMFNKKEEGAVVVVEQVENKNGVIVVKEEVEKKKPDVVKLPDAGKQDFPSLKLTVEESEGGGSNHLWQVYALGGFMVLRWAWGRWKESKAKKTDKPDSGDEEPSRTDDP